MKNLAIDLNIPIMDRKWANVNNNYINRNKRTEEIFNLFDSKKSYCEISKILNVSKESIMTAICRRKKNNEKYMVKC